MNGNHILKWKIYRTFFLLGPKDYRNFLQQRPRVRGGSPAKSNRQKSKRDWNICEKAACLFLIFLVSSLSRDATCIQSRIRNPRRVFIFSSQVYVRITKKNSIVLPKSLSILLLYCSGPSFRLLFVLDAKPTQFPKKENMKTYENIWKLTRNTYESLMKIEWKPSEIY